MSSADVFRSSPSYPNGGTTMIWQDFVFMIGSGLSIVFLAPTLRDAAANVPLATSAPSMVIGGIYAFTFATLGMSFSAAGALATRDKVRGLLREPDIGERRPFRRPSRSST